MMALQVSRKSAAFTLIELLCVIAIIAILAALLFPVLNQGQSRAHRIECVNHLKEVGIAFHAFAHDHKGKFPMELLSRDGGTQEFVESAYLVNGAFYFSFRHFQPLSNDLVTPKLLTCPTDLGRQPAANFHSLKNENLSYFVGVTADFERPTSILAGDRNVTNDAGRSPTILRSGFGVPVRWTQELHRFEGNLLFADAHVEELDGPGLAAAGRQAQLNADWFLPSIQPPAPTPVMTAANTANSANPATPVAAKKNGTRPHAPTSPSTGKGGASGLMFVEARSMEAATPDTIMEPTTNALVTAPAPVESAEPIQPDPEVISVSSEGVMQALIYKGAWLICLLLLLLLLALVSKQVRHRLRKITRMKA